MKKYFSRNKIRGISYTNRIPNKKNNYSQTLSNIFEIKSLLIQIHQGSPKPLSNFEIHYYLREHGRNKIHTHVSECTDSIAKWNGIVKVLERCVFNKNQYTEYSKLTLEDEKESFQIYDDLSVYLSAKKILSLWKHRLTIFEMIVEAQGSYRIRN